jgi:hypothetical protein
MVIRGDVVAATRRGVQVGGASSGRTYSRMLSTRLFLRSVSNKVGQGRSPDPAIAERIRSGGRKSRYSVEHHCEGDAPRTTTRSGEKPQFRFSPLKLEEASHSRSSPTVSGFFNAKLGKALQRFVNQVNCVCLYTNTLRNPVKTCAKTR